MLGYAMERILFHTLFNTTVEIIEN